MGKKRFLAVAVCAAAVMGLGANAALAGEVTGNGKPTPIGAAPDNDLHAGSICSFSGQNDNPTSTNPENPPGRVQSYGYSAIAQQWTEEGPPHAAGQGNGGVPGEACRGSN